MVLLLLTRRMVLLYTEHVSLSLQRKALHQHSGTRVKKSLENDPGG